MDALGSGPAFQEDPQGITVELGAVGGQLLAVIIDQAEECCQERRSG